MCVWVASTALLLPFTVVNHCSTTHPHNLKHPLNAHWRHWIWQDTRYFRIRWTSASHRLVQHGLHWAASVRMLARLSANDSPPLTLSSGTHRTKSPKWRSSPNFEMESFQQIADPKILFQTFIACLFSWCATITRRVAGRFEVFLLLSFKPNYYKSLEPVLYPNILLRPILYWWLTVWQHQLSLLFEVLQNWVDILKGFIDFCSHLKPTRLIKSQAQEKLRPWPRSGRLCRKQIWGGQYAAWPSWWCQILATI